MRINVIPPGLLADQHLLAEYRELKMLPKALVRSLKSKAGIDFNDLPNKYLLNKGHGKFFYNKLKYVEQRFEDILQEMRIRKFKTNFTSLYDDNYDYSCINMMCFSDNYKPSHDDMILNIERILLRINEKIDTKPYFYKFHNNTKSFDDFCNMYRQELNINHKEMFDIIDKIKNEGN